MPKNWADRAIMFSVIALVGWAIVGLPIVNSFSRASHQSSQAPSNHYSDNQADAGEPWLTKDAAGFFTFWLVVFASIQALLFLWQLWLIRESLNNTKIAAEAAKDGAQAARDSVSVSQEALVAAQRAYVAIKSISKSATIDAKTSRVVGWDIFVVYENAGNTPTRNFKRWINLAIRKNELPTDWDFRDVWIKKVAAWKGDENAVTATINAKGTLPSISQRIPVEVAEQIQEGKLFLYIWGWASYRDVFPDTPLHIIRFASQGFIDGDVRQKDRTTFTFVHLDKHNCIDDECEKTYPAIWIPPDYVLPESSIGNSAALDTFFGKN